MTGARRDDEEGAMLVVEAILVALLVLTAILYFTSVNRPSTGSDSQGIDLASIAADTLAILETQSFTVDCVTASHPSGPDNACEILCQGFDLDVNSCQVGPVECDADPAVDDCCPLTDTDEECALRRGALMRLLAAGDGAVADKVDGFLSAVVPAGGEYVLRLDNGVEPMPLLPVNPEDDPHGARTAKGLFFPADWDPNQLNIGASTQYAQPGQVVAAGTYAHTWMTVLAGPTEVKCIVSPTGFKVGPDGSDAGDNPDTWLSVWRTGGATARVPRSLPYGTWIGYTDTGCNAGPTVLVLTLPGSIYPGQPITVASAVYPWTQTAGGPACLRDPTGDTTTIDGPDPENEDDVGLGSDNTAPDKWVNRWKADPDDTEAPWKVVQAQVPIDAPAGMWTAYSDAACTTVLATAVLSPTTPYVPYGLELVVWFGA